MSKATYILLGVIALAIAGVVVAATIEVPPSSLDISNFKYELSKYTVFKNDAGNITGITIGVSVLNPDDCVVVGNEQECKGRTVFHDLSPGEVNAVLANESAMTPIVESFMVQAVKKTGQLLYAEKEKEKNEKKANDIGTKIPYDKSKVAEDLK